MAGDWKMLVDVGQQLIFPPEIAPTNLMLHSHVDGKQ